MEFDSVAWLSLQVGHLLKNRAYLDPGSGSFILQLLLASLLGLGFVIRAYWKKIIGIFKKSDDDIFEEDEE